MINEFLLENHVEQYENAAYSSLCDLFLFLKVKKQLRVIRFNDDNEIFTALEQTTYRKGLGKNFCSSSCRTMQEILRI